MDERHHCIDDFPDATFLEEAHAVVSAISDCVFVVNDACRFVFVNKSLLAFLQTEYSEIIGSSICEAIEDNNLATRLDAHVREVFATSNAIVDKVTHTCPGTPDRHCEYVLHLHDDGGGRRVVGAIRDITERKQLEQAVLKSHHDLYNVLESVSGAFYAVNRSWEFTYVNQHAADMLQRSRDKLKGSVIWDAFPEAEAAGLRDIYQRAWEDEEPASFDFFYQPLDIWFEVQAHPAPDVLSVYFHDITEDIRLRQELQASARRYRTLTNSMAQMVWLTDADGQHTFYNDRWYEYTGLSVEESLQFGFANALHPDDVERTLATWKRSWQHGVEYEIEYRFYSRSSGEYRWFLGRAMPVVDDSGVIKEWVGTCTDIHPQKEVEARLAESERRLANAQRISRIGSWDLDLTTGRFLSSPEHSRIYGLEHDDENATFDIYVQLLHPEDRPKVRAAADRAIAENGSYNIEYRIIRPDADERVVQTIAEVELDNSGVSIRLNGTTHDVTERKDIERELQNYAEAQANLTRELVDLTNSLEVQVEERTEALKRLSTNLERLVDERTAELEASREELAHQVRHDPLTGLPNRNLFEARLQAAIENADRTGDAVAVLFIDLDGFKLANDSLGHTAGDMILKEVGQRLSQHHNREGIAARHGGDEFVALLERAADDTDARSLARTLLDVIRRPYFIDGHSIQISASIGISMYPRDDDTPVGLLRKADVAMYRAKLSGKNDIRFYSASMDADVAQRLDIATHLSGAIARTELSLQYQAQLDVDTGTIQGFEALLHWQSPVLGNVSPADLIAVAEQTGMIVDIGDWVLEEACLQMAHWSLKAGRPVRMSVDVAAAQLARSDFVDIVSATLQQHGLQPAQLELEMTERTLSRDLELSRSRLQELGELGVRIAIDNFGLRGSSLHTLVYLPIQTVKIDPVYVTDIPQHMPSDRAVQAIVSLAQGIGLEVVADGVDSVAQRDRLVQLGATRLQGLLVGRPLNASAAHSMVSIHDHSGAPSGNATH